METCKASRGGGYVVTALRKQREAKEAACSTTAALTDAPVQ
jgi:hypothetical protein